MTGGLKGAGAPPVKRCYVTDFLLSSHRSFA